MFDPISTPSRLSPSLPPAASVVGGCSPATQDRFAAPWQVDIGPSRLLVVVLVAAHLAAGLSVALAAPSFPVTVALFMMVAFSGWFQIGHVACVSRAGSIVRLQACADGAVVVVRRDGCSARGRLLASTVVGWRLTLVRFRIDGQRFSCTVPLLVDNCDVVRFRRLRVGLAWQASTALRH